MCTGPVYPAPSIIHGEGASLVGKERFCIHGGVGMIFMAIISNLVIMAIMVDKLLYKNGQLCGQFMGLSREWPNSRNIQKELS